MSEKKEAKKKDIKEGSTRCVLLAGLGIKLGSHHLICRLLGKLVFHVTHDITGHMSLRKIDITQLGQTDI